MKSDFERSMIAATALVLLVGIAAGACAAAAGPPPSSSVAEIRYVQHSGWLVLTSDHVLIFDYVDSVDSIAGVQTLPREVAPQFDKYEHRRVVVFVTHSHPDHYSPSVFDWSANHPGIQYVLGVGVPSQGNAARVMSPHEDWSSEGLRIRTTGSTDEGVGFLVIADGITIFHAGDHALWRDSDLEAFDGEIKWLASQGASIDIAFFPIATGFSCEPRSSIWRGVQGAALDLRPKVLLPMHVACATQLELYERFRTESAPSLPGTQIMAPAAPGEWFRYEGRVLSRK